MYKPKWPYFWDLNFLDEHFKNGVDVRKRSNSSAKSGDYMSYLNGNGVTSNILTNILNAACAKSPMDDEENGSTDSAFASSTSEHSNADQECIAEPKPDSTLLTIQQLFSAATNDQTTNQQRPTVGLPPEKRSRSRKAAPARLQKPAVNSNESSFDWLHDNDELFGKIIALRLRNLDADKKRQMKISIEQLFERQERGE